MVVFMRMKNEHPKLKQTEITNQLRYSTSTLQRYRNDKNMLPPYRIHPNNTNKKAQKRLQIQKLITIQIVTLILKDLN